MKPATMIGPVPVEGEAICSFASYDAELARHVVVDEELAIEMAGVPVDQHTTYIEDDNDHRGAVEALR